MWSLAEAIARDAREVLRRGGEATGSTPPRRGGPRAARTCDREALRAAGPATRRGDRVEKHVGAGRALTHSSLAFVIGLPSCP